MPFPIGSTVYTHPAILINEGWLEKDFIEYIIDGVVECKVTGQPNSNWYTFTFASVHDFQLSNRKLKKTKVEALALAEPWAKTSQK